MLVHGSRALHYLKNCGESVEPHGIIADMVRDGVLIPVQVDLASSDPLSLQYKNASYIRNSPWCAAHALFWTYRPVNTTPMREWHE